MNAHIFSNNLSNVHLHFVGIKGTGMTALVEICHARGAIITGSDVSDVFYTDEILHKCGITSVSFDANNITDLVTAVIYSSAYKIDTNPDLIAAKEKNLPLILYSQALGEISKTSYSCSIAGVHGKTTTTGITGTLIKALELPAQVLAGSVIKSFNDSCTINLGHTYFIAETCEYQKHFMSFHPQKILLTSVESDHQDFYPTYESIRDAFVDFICLLPPKGQLIYCADEKGAVEVAQLSKQKRSDISLISYGEKDFCDYQLQWGNTKDELQHFTVNNSPYVLCIPGEHNVRNTCGALALVSELLKREQVPFSNQYIKKMQQGVKAFVGSRRRCEILGNKKGILFIDDYAHHPTAIKTTLAGLRAFYPNRRLIVDFMSHTYSRTSALLDDFAASFDCADLIILHKIYNSAREIYNGGINGLSLYEKVYEKYENVFYFEEVMDAKDFLLSKLQKNDLFITLGAGDNWKLGKALFDVL